MFYFAAGDSSLHFTPDRRYARCHFTLSYPAYHRPLTLMTYALHEDIFAGSILAMIGLRQRAEYATRDKSGEIE
jgi:hypothetical protein